MILSLPLLFGLWTWVTLGHTPPRYVYVLLVVGLGAHVVATSIGWIMAGFAERGRIAVDVSARWSCACHAAL